MAVMFVLALATAAYALVARQRAKKSELTAIKAQQLADDLKKVAESQRDEKTATAARLKEEKEKAEQLTASLQEEQGKTKAALESAQESEKRAENEAAIARARENDARTALKLADSNAKQGGLVRYSLESLQRGDYFLARSSLTELIDSLNTSLEARDKLPKKEMQRLNSDLGWAHAHVGSTWFATGDYETAKGSYEEGRKKLEGLGANQQDDDRANPEPTLYETYNGLGKTYQLIGLAGAGTKAPGQQPYYKQAEELYLKALQYHEARVPLFHAELQSVEIRGAAEGHLNLARLYRDMGETGKAEENFKAVAKSDLGIPGEQPSGRRELAEFYRDQGRYEEAIRAYQDLIIENEKFQRQLEDYAKYGREIANTYEEWADVYRAWADTKTDAQKKELESKAAAVFSFSTVLQRFTTRLRRELASPGTSGPTDLDNLAEDIGDEYLKFGKYEQAATLYAYATEVRKHGDPADQRDLGIGYVKLGKLYLAQKDYAKAEQSYKDQVAFYQSQPQSADYASALRDLGSLYAEVPNSPPEVADNNYRAALAIYRVRQDWYNQDIVLYRLTKLYERGNQLIRKQALEERVTTLAEYYAKLVARQPITPNNPSRLVSEYLQAVNGLGYFLASNDPAKAEIAYQRAWEMRDYMSTNVVIKKDEKTQRFFTAVLGDYQQLLIKQNKSELAAAVRDFRDKLNLEQERGLTQRTTQASAAP